MRKVLSILTIFLALSVSLYGQTLRVDGKTVRTEGLTVVARGEASATFCDEYQAVYNQFIVPPSEADATAQNLFVETLVDGGVWSELDRMFVMASHASGRDSLLDWLDPSNSAKLATIVNSPSWVQYQGYKGNVTTMYITTNFSVSGSSKMKVNVADGEMSFCIGAYQRDNGTGSGDRSWGSIESGKATYEQYYQTPDILRTTIDSDNWIGSGTFVGMYHAEALQKLATFPDYWRGFYKNGVGISDFSVQSGVDATTNDFYISAVNNNGSPFGHSDRQVSLFYIGKELGDTKVLLLYNAFQALMTYYGTQV